MKRELLKQRIQSLLESMKGQPSSHVADAILEITNPQNTSNSTHLNLNERNKGN